MPAPAIGLRPRFLPSTATIDESHPLAANLQFCGVPSLGRDLVKNRPGASIAGRSTTQVGPSGSIRWSSAATTDLAFTAGPFSLAVVVRLPTAAVFDTFFERALYTSELVNVGWQVQYRSAFTVGFSWQSFRNNGASNYTCARNSAYTPNEYVVVAVSNGSNLRELYVNNARDATNVNNANPLASNSDLILSINTAVAYAWSRALSPNEVAMLTAAPTCILRY